MDDEFQGRAAEPKTVTETVRAIWSRVLKVDEIRDDDTFFGLGGSSIKVMIMLRAVEVETDSKVDLAEFFDQPTLKDLVDLILR